MWRDWGDTMERLVKDWGETKFEHGDTGRETGV